jgi:hypothetical protein
MGDREELVGFHGECPTTLYVDLTRYPFFTDDVLPKFVAHHIPNGDDVIYARADVNTDVDTVINTCVYYIETDNGNGVRKNMAVNLLKRALFMCNAAGYHRGYVDRGEYGR